MRPFYPCVIKLISGISQCLISVGNWDFPGGRVVKNPPANTGDMGSIPGLRRSHMPRSNPARKPQLLSLRSRAREPQLLKPTVLEPTLRNKRSHRSEKPVHHNEE